MKHSIVYLLTLSLIGCVKIADSESESTPKPSVSQNYAQKSALITVTAKANGQFDSYHIQISADPQCQVIAKFQGNNALKLIPNSGGTTQIQNQTDNQTGDRSLAGQAVDSEAVAGQTYEYKCSKGLDTEDENILDRVSIAVPKDLTVSGSELSKDLQLQTSGRMFIAEKSVFKIGSNNLRLQASEIILKDTKFITFESDSHASAGQSGRPGGNINLKAKLITGNASVLLQGQHGGDGESAKPITEPAARGQSGYFNFYPGGNHHKGVLCFNIYFMPSNGSDGVAGKRGDNGGHGGFSGNFYADADQVDAEIKIQKAQGLGGQGGYGGAGQPGGEPGLHPKDFDQKNLSHPDFKCFVGEQPKPGRQGIQGLNGVAGENGKLGEFCLIESGTKTCQ